MATISDIKSARTNSQFSTKMRNDDHKKKKKQQQQQQRKEDDEGTRKKLALSSTNGYQGAENTEKANDSIEIGKIDTLSAVQSTNVNKKSNRMSPTMNESSDNKTKRKNGEKTIKTTQQKEESRSAPMSSVSITNKNVKTEEASSSSSNHNEVKQKDETLTPLSTANTMKKRPSISTTSEPETKESNPSTADSVNDAAFPIEKGDAQHLTDFQLEKAKYFFNVNLDIENKEYVTWEDVEFYLLFHATAAGKEGSDGGVLEARLNRAAKAFWDHVHDQVPLPDNKHDTLTLDQFLDTWAGLIDYVVRTNQLPPIVQDLVKLGFELYATDNGNGKSATIQPAAFDQLFQKMNIGRPYAIMAYKYLTENGTKPLDADKIDSIVKAVITSSDDEHDSHFLLPGFFKTIASGRNHDKDIKTKPQSPGPEEDLSETSEKSSSSSTSTSTTTSLSQAPLPKSQPVSESSESSSTSASAPAPPPQQPSSPPPKPSLSPSFKEQPNPSERHTASPYFLQKTSPPPPASTSLPSTSPPRFSQQPQRQQTPSLSRSPSQRQEMHTPSSHQLNRILQNSTIRSSSLNATTPSRQIPPPSIQPKQPKIDVQQQEDENIRSLLRYYHIDDGDVFEVADGPLQRLVLIHPERPVPSYIQSDRNLLTKLRTEKAPTPPSYQNGTTDPMKKSPLNGKLPHDFVSKQHQQQPRQPPTRVESLKDPMTRLRQVQTPVYSSSPVLGSTYSNDHSAHSDEVRRKSKRHEAHAVRIKKKLLDDSSVTSDISSSKQDEKRVRKDRTSDDEEKIVATVLKHLAPIVEKRVAQELRRIDEDETDQDEDDTFIPFPFMLGTGLPLFNEPNGGPPPSEHDSKHSHSQQHQHQQQTAQRNGTHQDQDGGEQHKQTNGHRVPDFGGAAFLPPPLFMAMMSDLARGGPAGEIPGFTPDMMSPNRGPDLGFMMFVDNNQMMGGPAGFPSRPPQRF
ncbi:unnamed protein product [Adineta ricciae]|uniref:Uncharacterized protein n=1 Tax=Adineta ricciae TaxID=249248 RepID=A0A815FGG7_ADIRI|nr:unnamed protein product [Adineta ricciae]